MPYYERDYYSYEHKEFRAKPWALYILLIVIAAIFIIFEIIIANMFSSIYHPAKDFLSLGIVDVIYKFKIWQLATYGLLHASPWHLFLNGLGLWFIGRTVNMEMGHKRFILLILASTVIGGMLHCALFIPSLTSVGAAQVVGISGGVFGILAYFCTRYPNQSIMLFPLPISFRAKWFLIGAVVISFLLLFYKGGGSVSHAAHLGGMLTGFLWVKIITKRSEAESTMRNNEFQYIWQDKSEKKGFFQRRKDKKKQRKIEKELENDKKIREQIDGLLDKIKQDGISSLTEKEKEFLMTNSQNYKN